MSEDCQHIIYFDGQCHICQGWVRFVMKYDKTNTICFSSLQSDYALPFKNSLPEKVKSMDTIIFSSGNEVYYKSNAAIAILNKMGGIWASAQILKIFPASIRDAVYDWIAANRYKWFGKSEECALLDITEFKSRLLQ